MGEFFMLESARPGGWATVLSSSSFWAFTDGERYSEVSINGSEAAH